MFHKKFFQAPRLGVFREPLGGCVQFLVDHLPELHIKTPGAWGSGPNDLVQVDGSLEPVTPEVSRGLLPKRPREVEAHGAASAAPEEIELKLLAEIRSS